MILEEVALDAVFEGGRLVARTSARQIADRLGVDPTTVAKALQTLRKRGLVTLEREKGPAGRFGLSVYTLGPAPGLTLVSPCAADPCMVSPLWLGRSWQNQEWRRRLRVSHVAIRRRWWCPTLPNHGWIRRTWRDRTWRDRTRSLRTLLMPPRVVAGRGWPC